MGRKLERLAIIPDGNRRFGRKIGAGEYEAYVKGFQKVREAIEWAKDVHSLTFWALSLDNFRKRSALELKVLFQLMAKHIDEALQSKKLFQEGVRVSFFGRKELLPASISTRMRELEEKTVENEDRLLNFGVAYSGRDELLNAAKSIALDLKNGKLEESELTQQVFEERLYYRESPDLVIRTGNEQRLSGFLPWQTEYSELYFSKKLWPEFTKRDYDEAVRFFETSESRKGK